MQNEAKIKPKKGVNSKFWRIEGKICGTRRRLPNDLCLPITVLRYYFQPPILAHAPHQPEDIEYVASIVFLVGRQEQLHGVQG